MGPIRAMLADVGITEQQWRVLRVLHEAGPLDPTRIAEQACLLLPSLTRILQKLDEKGMILREADTVDRRKQVISISAKGTQLIEDNLATSIEIMDRIRAQMGHDKYESLLDLLNDLDRVVDPG
jgi:homoprotocatechuate degradation regulator HpaR